VAASGQTFPLVPRRRLIGHSFGALRSARRGVGSDVASSRSYRSGDAIDTIDWNASARLSSALGRDEFIVRTHYADEAPHVVAVCDRRPEMALYPPWFPWLSKRGAMSAAVTLVRESAASIHALVGYLDFAGDEPYWCRPESERAVADAIDGRLADARFSATRDTVERGLEQLAAYRFALPPGTFVFVFSDFLAGPSRDAWLAALAHGWDIVPVVIQDPVWERSFPAVGGIALPLADPATGQVHEVRLTDAEADARRRENEERARACLELFAEVGLDPIELSCAAPDDVLARFVAWADERVYATVGA